jgi:hypothetical protein
MKDTLSLTPFVVRNDIVGSIRQRYSIDFDVNPIALLASKVKTTILSEEDSDSINLAVSRIEARLKAKDHSELDPENPKD